MTRETSWAAAASVSLVFLTTVGPATSPPTDCVPLNHETRQTSSLELPLLDVLSEGPEE